MRYGVYKKTHFEDFGNRAFCQRTAVYNTYIVLSVVKSPLPLTLDKRY